MRALLFFLFWLGSAVSQSHKRYLAASDVSHYSAKNNLTDTEYTCFESHFLKQCPVYKIIMFINAVSFVLSLKFSLDLYVYGPLYLSRSVLLLCGAKLIHCCGFSMRKGNNKIMRHIPRALISCLTPGDDLCSWLPLL